MSGEQNYVECLAVVVLTVHVYVSGRIKCFLQFINNSNPKYFYTTSVYVNLVALVDLFVCLHFSLLHVLNILVIQSKLGFIFVRYSNFP